MRRPVRWLLSLSLAASCASFTACKESPKEGATTQGGGSTAPSSGTGPVARVNGVDIPRDAFARQMDRTRARFQQAKREIPPALEVRLKENIIRKLVDDELIGQRAKAEGIALSDQEVETKLAEHKARFGSPDAFKGFLERTGQSEEDLREELKRTELRDRLFNKVANVDEPSDEEVKDFYDKNLDRYKEREQVQVIQVMWKSDKAEAADVRKKVEARAKTAAAELKKKGTDFKTKIATYTDAAPSPNGGDLGWVQRGRQVKQIEDAIFDAKVKPGDVVGPIESNFGFHVLKVVDKKPERQKPLEEVAPAIKTAIKARKRSEKTRDVLTTMKKDAKVEVLEPGVTLDPKPVAAPPGPMQMPGAPGQGMPPGMMPPGHPMPGQAIQGGTPVPQPGQPIQVQPAQPAEGQQH